ncbi:winged helix-turn-helix domain-containing protein [Bacillus sonorensis]|uniref:winged helix-turn-helix domain-containing protein n=1 Tax=Bacillus sonorensis TaxID=119858 RepID=UPI00098B26D0|nr:winged helix-turn-helix domain-containing protein [Bacillus sonorensis]
MRRYTVDDKFTTKEEYKKKLEQPPYNKLKINRIAVYDVIRQRVYGSYKNYHDNKIKKFVNGKGEVFGRINQTEIAEKCRISESTVKRAIKDLMKFNLIEVEESETYGKHGGKSNKYFICEPTPNENISENDVSKIIVNEPKKIKQIKSPIKERMKKIYYKKGKVTNKAMAEFLGVSVKTVQRKKAELRAEGYLIDEKTQSKMVAERVNSNMLNYNLTPEEDAKLEKLFHD